MGRIVLDPTVLTHRFVRPFPDQNARIRNRPRLAPPRELTATARAYHTIAQTLPAGHDMMLDTAWEQAASAIQAAITRSHANR